MTQPSLFPTDPPTGLTCVFGSLWGPTGCGPCAGCVAESDRLEAAFWQGVARGEYDQAGYRPRARRPAR